MAESVLIFLIASLPVVALALIWRTMLLRIQRTAWLYVTRCAFLPTVMLWASMVLPSWGNERGWHDSGFQVVAGLLTGLSGAALILVFAEIKLQRIRRARGFPVK
jgi:hypothetical protein